ncbi:MAG: FAD-dependent oxidoreductase [Bacteroidetes bacterium]|nr:FAD-dependent oxidoreductase [Bacteroidota bacterium]
MNRKEMLAAIEENQIWDVVIIGGGASGAGIALDSASRGYKTLLIERADFSSGTSSRSTKLVHGGVRYLQQGNIALVLEALKERGIMRKNAPHLVHDLPFIVPNYDWWEGPFYGIGMKIYDMLAGREGFGNSELLSLEETVKHIPTVEQEGLNGGVIYYDGQFDDARLVINLIKTAAEQGGVAVNYMEAVSLTKTFDLVSGVEVRDLINDKEYNLKASVVINATGPFTDSVRKMDCQDCLPMISPSQGVHMVLDKSFLPGDSAIMVPHTDDGRVLFAIPWHDKIVVGTTDTPITEAVREPIPLEEEVNFLLEHTARYLTKDPTREDILSVFAGVRPLVVNPEAENTAAISREHVVSISKSGLVTIAGGKWTTYRKMAEDTLEQAIMIGQLEPEECKTKTLNIHGYHNHADAFGALECYGSDALEIQGLAKTDAILAEKIIPEYDAIKAEVIWAVREEMAMTIEDFLSRRRRYLILDTRASLKMAPVVAGLMAKEMGKDAGWIEEQVAAYKKLAENYLV